MDDFARQLVDDVVALTGTAPPAVLDPDAPVLSGGADEDAELYYVGLIGGKDVGKTSLVNALAGQTIAEPTGHGEGTRSVTAYAHHDAVEAVKRELGDVAVVPHGVNDLRRQVLLDLPDIDSKYADHIALTRRMLRHMLFPVWIQSVEKYADQRPQQLLKQVAAGNDPANFLFVLNKTDQLIKREGLEAAGELADDYAARLKRVLELPSVPEVLLVSATHPTDYDLPRLRKLMGVQRSQKQIRQSRKLAIRRRLSSVVDWVEDQDLAGQAQSVQRLTDDAGELIAERLGVPVLEVALPRLEKDTAHRIGLAEPAVRTRLRAWPIVNVFDAAFSPIVQLVRKNLAPAGDESAALESYLVETGRSTAKNLQAVFAQLHGLSPIVAELYSGQRLWESPAAEEASLGLRRRLSDAIIAQREAIRARVEPKGWLAPIRWLLTVGAALWFILIQPLLETLVGLGRLDVAALIETAIETLSAEALLTNAGFAFLWLLALWLVLRFGTYRRVVRLRRRLLDGSADPALSPASATLAWMEELLAPLDRRRARLQDLADRAATLGNQLDSRQAA